MFHNADVVLCNLESAISDRGAPQKGRSSSFISRLENINVLKKAGIAVVSFANDHSMDFGPEAMLQTLDLLDQYGVAHAGAGASIVEARKPVFVEKKRITLAFLAYATNINTPRGFSATPETPGLAPLRLSPYFSSPHVNKEDLNAMELDIKEAKKNADLVTVLSLGDLRWRTVTRR